MNLEELLKELSEASVELADAVAAEVSVGGLVLSHATIQKLERVFALHSKVNATQRKAS